jgi:hypothetical protein
MEYSMLYKNLNIQIDPEDEYLLKIRKWDILNEDNPDRIELKATIKGHRVMLHRFIMKADNGHYVKFIDGNRLNFMKENLTTITISQGMHERKRKSKSEHKGIMVKNNRLVVAISWKRKQKIIGRFPNTKKGMEDAITTYNEMAKLLYS